MSVTGDTGRWARLERLFEAALLWPEAERRERLDAACADDPWLRHEVDRMLAADSAGGGILDRATQLRNAALPAAPDLEFGHRIGSWRVIGILGRGGMGVVYLVERADGQYQQQAALKVIRGGWLAAELAPRFQRERQILARLQHPGIAQLLDAGNTTDGLPYFVMERVHGLPITEWCALHDLDADGCVALLLGACDAVQHAHRNFVVHRDLKPANMLVDDGAHVRLLDFGIATWIEEAAAGTPDLTVGNARAFTPEFAAPEQLGGGAITTATDVYSLGVVLNALLAGVRERRGTAVDRDLDAITGKATAPDPALRYQTVEAFADDLRRHLRDEPVLARAAGRWYRARRFLARHRWGSAAAATLFIAVTIGVSTTLWQARLRAAEARKAQAVTHFVAGLFEAVDPARARGSEPTARDLLDAGAARLSHEPPDEPALRGAIAALLGDLYGRLDHTDRSLELLQEAVDQLARAHGPDSPELARARLLRARAFVARAEDAAALADLSLARPVLHATGDARDEAEALDLAAIVEGRRGNDAAATQFTQAALALRIAALGGEHPEVATSYNNLGVLARNRGDYVAARELHERALTIRRRSLPADHPHLAISLNNLGALDLAEGELSRAVARFEEAHDISTRVSGESHQETIATLNNLGGALLRLGRLDDAEAAWQRVLSHWQQTGRAEHPNALATRLNLATVRRLRGDLYGALAEYGQLAAAFSTALGPDHPLISAILTQQARCLAELGELEPAAALMSEALRARIEAHGPVHPDNGDLLRELGVLALLRGDVGSAERNLARAIELQSAGLPPLHPSLLMSQLWLGSVLRATGRAADATVLQATVIDALRSRLAGSHPDLATAEGEFGRSLLAAGRYADAGEQLQRARVACAGRLGRVAWPCLELDLDLAAVMAASGRAEEGRALRNQALRELHRILQETTFKRRGFARA